MRKISLFLFFSVITLVINAYNISNNGKEFIKKHETCVLTAYWDSNGYSIGWGHHSKAVYKGMKISKSQANVYFNKDIKEVEKAANRIIDSLPYEYKFSQNFFDGLCSLVYNCGESGVKSTNFYKRLKACRIKNGKMDLSDFNYTMASVKTSKISCPGHKLRRLNEYKLMIN